METNTIKPAAHARARPRLINIDQLGTANPDVKQAVVFGRLIRAFIIGYIMVVMRNEPTLHRNHNSGSCEHRARFQNRARLRE
jgi:hypothetical protein